MDMAKMLAEEKEDMLKHKYIEIGEGWSRPG